MVSVGLVTWRAAFVALSTIYCEIHSPTTHIETKDAELFVWVLPPPHLSQTLHIVLGAAVAFVYAGYISLMRRLGYIYTLSDVHLFNNKIRFGHFRKQEAETAVIWFYCSGTRISPSLIATSSELLSGGYTALCRLSSVQLYRKHIKIIGSAYRLVWSLVPVCRSAHACFW